MVLLRLFAFPAAGGAPMARAAVAPKVAAPAAAPRMATAPVGAAPSALHAAVAPARPTQGPAPKSSPPPAASSAARAPSSLEPPPWVEEADESAYAPQAAPETAPEATHEAAHEVARELRAAPLRAPSPPAMAMALPVTAPAEALAVVPTLLGDRWNAVARRLDASGVVVALTRELAWQATLTAAEQGDAGRETWTLMVESASLRADSLRDKLQAALAAELGSPVQLNLVAGVPVDSPARRDAVTRARRQAEAEAIIRTDPVVVDVLARFKTARIVSGSIKPLSSEEGTAS
jgi:DNA polymerase-3 subunit gamma/tau